MHAQLRLCRGPNERAEDGNPVRARAKSDRGARPARVNEHLYDNLFSPCIVQPQIMSIFEQRGRHC